MSDPPQPSTSNESRSVVSSKRKPEKQVVLSAENRAIKLVKKPRIMLEEDDFTGELEKIITRDYFPEVPRLKVNILIGCCSFLVLFQAQQAYMDAMANNDVEKIRELQLRYSCKFTNGSNPKTVRRFKLNGGRFDVETEMEEVVVNPDGLNEEVSSFFYSAVM